MKYLVWLLIALLAFCPAVYAEATLAGSDSEWLYEEDAHNGDGWTEATDEDSEAFLIEDETDEDEDFFAGALEVYGWFEAQPLDVDPEKSSPDGSMFQVLDERFNTLRALDAYVRFYFSDALADALLSAGVYQEIDGYLYTNAQARALDEGIGEIELTVTDRTDSKILYTLTINRVDEQGQVTSSEDLTYTRELVGDSWRFTAFPYFL
jgi:hypothetical protein